MSHVIQPRHHNIYNAIEEMILNRDGYHIPEPVLIEGAQQFIMQRMINCQLFNSGEHRHRFWSLVYRCCWLKADKLGLHESPTKEELNQRMEDERRQDEHEDLELTL